MPDGVWRIDSGMMWCFSKGGVCISQSERPSRGWTWEGSETRVFLALFPLLFFTNKNFWRKSILSFQLIKQLNDYQVQTFVPYGWDCGYDLGFFHLCCERDKLFEEWQCHLGYAAPLAVWEAVWSRQIRTWMQATWCCSSEPVCDLRREDRKNAEGKV